MLFLLLVEERQLHPVNMFYIFRQEDNNILDKCVLLECRRIARRQGFAVAVLVDQLRNRGSRD
jgi:hypothetical protein